MASYYSNELAGNLREFSSAVADAQQLVARGEFDDQLWALFGYASTMLDVIDVQLLEAGLPPDARELAAAGKLREKFEHLLLTLATSSLRRR